ncbi:hypothetical protein [Actinocorallia populi]|uniref:hypothetical protein n=1 Tax=Actinocorallia populi TaxID=2079200 RepID=UPI0013004FFC|nr:hypothetical protein [Actinocorallia populi]
MSIRTMTGIAVLALAGTAIGVPAAAAPPARCALGTWKLTRAVLHVDSGNAHLRFSGGSGSVLTLDGRTALHSFGSSAKFTETGTSDGRPVSGWMRYRKTLRLKTRVSAARLTGSPASASGPATLKIRQTRPLNYDPSPQRVASLLRRGGFSGIPASATYTCGPGTLRLHQKEVSAGGTLNGTWSYRRL